MNHWQKVLNNQLLNRKIEKSKFEKSYISTVIFQNFRSQNFSIWNFSIFDLEKFQFHFRLFWYFFFKTAGVSSPLLVFLSRFPPNRDAVTSEFKARGCLWSWIVPKWQKTCIWASILENLHYRGRSRFEKSAYNTQGTWPNMITSERVLEIRSPRRNPCPAGPI